MDTQRIFIIAAIGFLSFFLLERWTAFKNPQEVTIIEKGASSNVPATPAVNLGDENVPSVTEQPISTLAVPITDDSLLPTNQKIRVETDLFVAQINTKGGGIDDLRLKNQLKEATTPDIGFHLLKDIPTEKFISQSGLIGTAGKYPNHYTQYSAAANEYVLNGDSIEVPLSWTADNGQQFTKTFRFSKNSYIIDIDYQLKNQQASNMDAYLYAQFERSRPLDEKKGSFLQLPSFMGGVIYTPEDKYKKISFSDIEDDKLGIKTDSGWVGMLQHYFVGVWMPKNDGDYSFYSNYEKLANPVYTIGYKTVKPMVLVPNQSGKLSASMFVGPKEQTRLKSIQNDSSVDGLALTVDYGWLTVIADPLFWILEKINSVVNNWGWSIILLTILIKLVFYPLSAASYKSMAKMKKLGPRMETLKERFSDDKAQLQQAMMKLYKEEKVNPAGGCLPILIQIPVFIALYYVLLESVELRHAPFALWWQDLTSPDPYYVLPILMGLSMFLQQKLNPAPMEQMQKNIMMIMPLVLTFLFLTFPQGLVLYWVVNNCLSIVQQWSINKTIGAN